MRASDVHGHQQGRIDLASGETFNRHFADLVPRVCEMVEHQLVDDELANVALVRRALRQACVDQPAATELQSLRRTLLGLAIDADVVLDLHSDAGDRTANIAGREPLRKGKLLSA